MTHIYDETDSQTISEGLAKVTAAFAALRAAAEHVASQFVDAYTLLDGAELLPPRNPRRGDRWVSPIDGARYRAGGRRGHPATWKPAGPRQRWWT